MTLTICLLLPIEKILENLKTNWENLLQPFQVDKSLSEKILMDLCILYSSEDRFYHRLEHIEQILCTIASLSPICQNLPALQLAAWFHDAIYNPKAKNNEEKSAEYAAIALTQLQIPHTIIDKVTKMILYTQYHQATTNDIDTQIFLDADLAILGANTTEYNLYAAAIRREYAWMTAAEYHQGRIEILQKFLQRKRIYLTDGMFNKLEKPARKNILTEIEILSSLS